MAKIVSIVGARPQFVKAAPVCRTLKAAHHVELLIHTGQHYDDNMSAIFFEELDIPTPAFNLGIGSGSHGAQTGAMLAGIEPILISERPDWVLIYGDTNSTVAGALAAAKLHIRIAHVEAGLRSFNRGMPEEINRVVADHLADLLLVPSQTAVDNLKAEGITHGVHNVGDVMADALAFAVERASGRAAILDRLGIGERGYLLATIHRPENTDNPERMRNILAAFGKIAEPIIFPIHPRTRLALGKILDRDLEIGDLKLIEPVGHLDMVRLEQSARMILTDSGGIQKEAYWLRVPCVTLRDETEWVETVQAGWNVVVAADSELIIQAVSTFSPPETHPTLYGDGHAAERIVALL